MKKVLKFFLLPAFAVAAAIIACNKSTEMTADEAVDQALYSIQERGNIGRFGCYELVFPVTLSLPDGSTVEVNSYDEMKLALRTYFAANGASRPQPSFVFPVSVISQDGEIITIDSDNGLTRLREACARSSFARHNPRGHAERVLSCFEIVFPITIRFPDGSTATAADRQALHQLIRIWRQNNPGATERPHVTFPVTVKMTADGSLVTLNNREELHDLKGGCE